MAPGAGRPSFQHATRPTAVGADPERGGPSLDLAPTGIRGTAEEGDDLPQDSCSEQSLYADYRQCELDHQGQRPRVAHRTRLPHSGLGRHHPSVRLRDRKDSAGSLSGDELGHGGHRRLGSRVRRRVRRTAGADGVALPVGVRVGVESASASGRRPRRSRRRRPCRRPSVGVRVGVVSASASASASESASRPSRRRRPVGVRRRRPSRRRHPVPPVESRRSRPGRPRPRRRHRLQYSRRPWFRPAPGVEIMPAADGGGHRPGTSRGQPGTAERCAAETAEGRAGCPRLDSQGCAPGRVRRGQHE